MENSDKTVYKFIRETGIKLFMILMLLNITACEEPLKDDVSLKSGQLPDYTTAASGIETANANFRSSVWSIIQQVSSEYKLPEIEDDFVVVNPISITCSPVALTKEATLATLAELAKGKDILLAYFNLPEDSEITSGFYILSIKKIWGEWIAILRTIRGRIVLIKKPVVETNTLNFIGTGRTMGIYNGKYAVRFGAQLKDISFYIDVRIGYSKRIIVPRNKYAEAITSEIKQLRGQIENTMQNVLGMNSNVFIATRNDALLVATLSDLNGAAAPLVYIRSNNIPSDFYSVSILQSQFQGAITDQQISTTFTDLSKYSSMKIGFVGGMIGDKINIGYVGSIIKGMYTIPLGY